MYQYAIQMEDGAQHVTDNLEEMRAWAIEHGATGMVLNLLTDDIVTDATWRVLTETLEIETGIVLRRYVPITITEAKRNIVPA
jgi:hypothetical protein